MKPTDEIREPLAKKPGHGMHILVVTGSYAPDRTGIAPLNTEFCEYLAARGHRVSVVTGFPHYPEWRIPESYRGKLWQRETRNGVAVCRGYIFVPAKHTTMRRILYDTSIGISTALRGLPIRSVDLVLAVSPPLQAALAGHFLSRIKRAPFLLQIKDLLPDLAIALNMLRNPLAIKLARKLERYLYARANGILVICEGFRTNLLSKGVPEGKVSFIPDWVDTHWICPGSRWNGFRKEHNLREEDFLVLHTGNMGAKQKLENLLESATELKKETGILFCLVGDGAERNRLRDCARQRALENVKFFPLQGRDMLPAMLSAADVLVLNQSAQVVDMVIPSKLLAYMAAGRPVIAAVSPTSEAARCIAEAGCGVVVQPEDPVALADAIQHIYRDQDMRTRFGERGRAYAERHFSSERILNRLEDHCRSAADRAKQTAEPA